MPASEGAGHHHEVEPVSRATQAGLGLFTGVVIYGTAMGGLGAGLRLGPGPLQPGGPARDRGLAGAGCLRRDRAGAGVQVSGEPAICGSRGETIGYRTRLFFLLLAVSIVGLALAAGLARRLWAGHGAWNALTFAGAGYILAMVLVMRALPAVNEVPEGFPADLLWNFRVAAIGI